MTADEPVPRHRQDEIAVETRGVGLYPVDDAVGRWLGEIGATTGLLTLFCRHTSASLTVQENADPAVLRDLAEYFARLVPENQPWVRHDQEGPDDMPAHIRSALTGVSLAIPVAGGEMTLGVWQGVYLFEHRRRPHRRSVVLHYSGY